MQFRFSRVLNAGSLVLGTLLVLAACSKYSNTGLVTPTASPTPTNSLTFSVAAAGSTQAMPAGFTVAGTATFPNATVGAGSNLTITETATTPSGLPNLNAPNAAIIFFSFAPAANVTFTGFPGFSFTLPAAISTTNEQFYIAFYDPKNPSLGWQTGYRGPATVSGQTLTFSGNSTTFAMLSATTYNYVLYELASGPTPTPFPNPSNIYISSGAAGATRNTLTIFPASANGNVIPTGTLGGAATGLNLPNGLAFGSNNVLYVANGAGSITEYPNGTSGNTAPSVTITSATLLAPQMIALDSTNNIFVTQNTATGGVDSVAGFAAASTGASAPAQLIAGAATGLSVPVGVALDSKGNVWVANSGNNSVTEYAVGSTGNVAPIATISGALTTLSGPTGIALDPTDNIEVANANNTVTVFKVASTGNVAPTTTIAGSGTLLNVPSELYVDANGVMYIANNGASGAGSNSVLEFLGTANGNALPLRDITGASTGLIQPFGVAAR